MIFLPFEGPSRETRKQLSYFNINRVIKSTTGDRMKLIWALESDKKTRRAFQSQNTVANAVNDPQKKIPSSENPYRRPKLPSKDSFPAKHCF